MTRINNGPCRKKHPRDNNCILKLNILYLLIKHDQKQSQFIYKGVKTQEYQLSETYAIKI